METLKWHYEPKLLTIAQWFHFHHHSQTAGESIAGYIAELRQRSMHCEFGTYLDQALRDSLAEPAELVRQTRQLVDQHFLHILLLFIFVEQSRWAI